MSTGTIDISIKAAGSLYTDHKGPYSGLNGSTGTTEIKLSVDMSTLTDNPWVEGKIADGTGTYFVTAGDSSSYYFDVDRPARIDWYHQTGIPEWGWSDSLTLTARFDTYPGSYHEVTLVMDWNGPLGDLTDMTVPRTLTMDDLHDATIYLKDFEGGEEAARVILWPETMQFVSSVPEPGMAAMMAAALTLAAGYLTAKSLVCGSLIPSMRWHWRRSA